MSQTRHQPATATFAAQASAWGLAAVVTFSILFGLNNLAGPAHVEGALLAQQQQAARS